MSDLLLDPLTGDIGMVGCSPTLTTSTMELVSQRLKIRLDTFLGEWFYNSEVGVPYFEEILTKRFNKDIITSILRSVILETEGVVSIVKFDSFFSAATRSYETKYSVEIDPTPSGSTHRLDVPFIGGNIIDNLSNSISLSGGSNLIYNTANPSLQC